MVKGGTSRLGPRVRPRFALFVLVFRSFQSGLCPVFVPSEPPGGTPGPPSGGLCSVVTRRFCDSALDASRARVGTCGGFGQRSALAFSRFPVCESLLSPPPNLSLLCRLPGAYWLYWWRLGPVSLFSGCFIKAARSNAIKAIPRRLVKHPRPARKNEAGRSVATVRLESDSATVPHPLLFSRRTRVRSILSALQFRCSLLILLDNYLHPSLGAFSFSSSVPPPLLHCPLSKHGLGPRRHHVVKQGRKRWRRGDGRDVAAPQGVGQMRRPEKCGAWS